MNSLQRHNTQGFKKGMSAIEDSEDFADVIQEVARLAAKAAVDEAKALKIPVIYLRGEEIIKKHPDGNIEVVGRIKKTEHSVGIKKGSVLHAGKK